MFYWKSTGLHAFSEWETRCLNHVLNIEFSRVTHERWSHQDHPGLPWRQHSSYTVKGERTKNHSLKKKISPQPHAKVTSRALKCYSTQSRPKAPVIKTWEKKEKKKIRMRNLRRQDPLTSRPTNQSRRFTTSRSNPTNQEPGYKSCAAANLWPTEASTWQILPLGGYFFREAAVKGRWFLCQRSVWT